MSGVAGFRTAEEGDGPSDGSIYSFDAQTLVARRFKRQPGGSDENTLRTARPTFFAKAGKIDEIHRKFRDRNLHPALQWLTVEMHAYPTPEQPNGTRATQDDGLLTPRPEENSHLGLRFYNKATKVWEETGYICRQIPEIGATPVQLSIEKKAITQHIGHPIAELFSTRADLQRKLSELQLPVSLDPATGQLMPPIFVRGAAKATTPVWKRPG